MSAYVSRLSVQGNSMTQGSWCVLEPSELRSCITLVMLHSALSIILFEWVRGNHSSLEQQWSLPHTMVQLQHINQFEFHRILWSRGSWLDYHPNIVEDPAVCWQVNKSGITFWTQLEFASTHLKQGGKRIPLNNICHMTFIRCLSWCNLDYFHLEFIPWLWDLSPGIQEHSYRITYLWNPYWLPFIWPTFSPSLKACCHMTKRSLANWEAVDCVSWWINQKGLLWQALELQLPVW